MNIVPPVMDNEFSAYLAMLLGSSADDNGGNVIELIFDLKILGIETLQKFKERENDDEIQEVIREYLNQ